MLPISVKERYQKTDQLLTRLKASETEIRFLQEVRENAPVSVPTNSGRENSLTEASPKKSSGKRITYGNLSLDDNARAWYDADPNVVEHHYLPVSAELAAHDDGGILRSRVQHAFGFLVVYADSGSRLEDWRSASFLTKLRNSSSSSGRYYEKPPDSGIWFDSLAQAYAKSRGVRHALRSKADMPDNLISNERFLADYRHPDALCLSDEIRWKLREALQRDSKSLKQLLSAGFTADQIFAAIVEGVAFVDLVRERLHETDRLLIHANAARSEIYRLERQATIKQYPVPLPAVQAVMVGDEVSYRGEMWEVTVLTSDDGKIERDGYSITLPILELSDLVKKQLESEGRGAEIHNRAARKRLFDVPEAALQDSLDRRKAVRAKDKSAYSERHLRRLNKTVQETSDPITQLCKFLDKRRTNSGNRKTRFGHPKVVELAVAAIKEVYNTPTCRKGKQAYRHYEDEVDRYNAEERKDQEPILKMGYTAFMKRVALHVDRERRDGQRRAYNDSDIPLRLDVGIPLHGIQPRDVLYLDNTLLPVMTRGPRGEDWGKVWLCAAIDGHTTKPCAAYVTYEHPSAKTALLLLRIYIQREKRLPRVLVVDGGSDFRSGGLQELCDILDIDLRHRPGPMPRTGTKIENMFAVMDSQFISALEGNSRQLKDNARLNTPEVDPVRRRVWQLAELARAVENYLYVERPSHIHPSGGGLSIEAYDRQRCIECGEREHKRQELTEDIMLITSPFATRKEHRVKKGVGVYLDGVYYWDKSIVPYYGESVTVRREPWYAGVIYVGTKDGWLVLTCRNPELWVRTSYEVQAAKKKNANLTASLAKRDSLSLERAKSMIAATDRSNFSDDVFMKQHIERLYAFRDRKFVTALPITTQVLDAVDNFIDAKGIWKDLASIPRFATDVTTNAPDTDATHTDDGVRAPVVRNGHGDGDSGASSVQREKSPTEQFQPMRPFNAPKSDPFWEDGGSSGSGYL